MPNTVSIDDAAAEQGAGLMPEEHDDRRQRRPRDGAPDDRAAPQGPGAGAART